MRANRLTKGQLQLVVIDEIHRHLEQFEILFGAHAAAVSTLVPALHRLDA
jgi:hypothetical protein